MKNMFYRVVFFDLIIKTYNKRKDCFEDGLLYGDDYDFSYNDFFVACHASKSMRDRVGSSEIYVDSYMKGV